MDYLALNQTTPPGYSYLDNPRPERRGGGIAVIYQHNLNLRPISIPATTSFEHLVFRLSGSQSPIVGIIYRPPKTCTSFLSDFTDFYTQLSSISPSVLLLGDFNIHVDNPHSKFTADFLDILNCLNLTQYVNSPTHSHGHILDLICSSASLSIDNITLTDLTLSDHLAVTVDIAIPSQTPKQTRKITYRNLKSLSPTTFASSVTTTLSSSPHPRPDSSTSELVDHHNQILSSCLNQFAPLKTATVSFSTSAPWYTPDLHNLKKKRRQLERLHAKTGLTVHAEAYKYFTNTYNTALKSARSDYFSQLIRSNSSNSRTLFSTFARLTKPIDNITSTFTTDKCNNYLSFFHSKIHTIHNTLQSSSSHHLSFETHFPVDLSRNHSLSSFSLLSTTDTAKLLSNMKLSTCHLDPTPSTLLKACIPSLTPLITNIINSSLTTGTVPPNLQIATIKPLLKKPNLDSENLDNFRPISNLPLLSKILERAVITQVQQYLHTFSLFEIFQSGFRPHHSTETALLKVSNDLLLAADSGSLSILLLLDLSAAFDTIDHSILLHRLQSIGISNTVLSWFSSYLSDRHHYVSINNCTSQTFRVSTGVPQGSVLGPLLFIMYMLPLGHIIRHHGLHFHCYADDTQVYISTKSISPVILSTITHCISDIKFWMDHNFLKLNSNKTELLITGPKSFLPSAQNISLNIDGHTVTPSSSVRNLGVIMDSTLSFRPHINLISKTSFFHLRNIARLLPSLSQSSAILVHAFITSRLDYCNSLLFGLPSTHLQKLQYIQNSAARLLTHTRSRDHITPVLKQLHWLPVPYRIQYKVLLLTYKSLHNLAPSYLTDLLHHHCPSRRLRSTDSNLLTPLRTKHRTLGDRAFAAAAPTLWNSLPQPVRNSDSLQNFKSLLKTHLFHLAFP
ncbi:unnamed protein product [Knipowitschia caucasica]